MSTRKGVFFRNMSKYNVYKIKEGQANELQTHLTSNRSYRVTGTYTSHGYSVSVLFSEAQPTDIWWLGQYADYFGEHSGKQNEIYSGAVIARRTPNGNAYIIPLGKTHFYIQDFIEINFGLELAERIADEHQAKMKSLKSFGGKTSKSLVSYNSEADLVFDSCESAEYLKLKASNKETWGKSFIHFGSSVQFNSSETEAADLGQLLSGIDTALAGARQFNLPLMKEVDKSQSAQLYLKLIQKISELDDSINFLDYEVYGVDFVFSQQTHVRLKHMREHSEQLTELTLSHIVTFAEANGINLAESLSSIKAQIFVGSESKYSVQLIKLIEYYDDETGCFLFRGKWFQFNESFIEALHRMLANVPVSAFGTTFSEAEFNTWRLAQTEAIKYRERFIIEQIHTQQGFEVLDRNLDYQNVSNKTYSIEVGDLYDAANETVIVAKIGAPRDFGYAFDQAFATLSSLQGRSYTTSGGRVIAVKEVELLLIFKTNRTLESATATGSLIFELKLNELCKLAREKGVQLKISYSTVL
jgi:uncharacterized protein (TIGR04141 family)